jgi:polysaccharide export outer membrane protein
MDSFMDPSQVGRWERTPVVLPILDRLDVIESDTSVIVGMSKVQPADLIPDVREYVIGEGDLITVTVFELIAPGVDSVNTRRVDELGNIRLPGGIGSVRAAGQSSSQLEKIIAKILEDKGLIQDASVTVLVQEARQNVFSIIGEPQQAGTAIGTYAIPHADFRLIDALALARGVPGRTKMLQIIRQIPLTAEVAGEVAQEPQTPQGPVQKDEPTDPGQLIEGLLKGVDEPAPDQKAIPAPPGMESGLDEPAAAPRYVNVDGKWVRVEQDAAAAPAQARTPAAGGEPTTDADLGALITQRVVEIPYDRLIAGDMRYNVVIRPGDVIKVPDPSAGLVYIMGNINRPGAFNVPGEKDLTLKQLVASAGNLSGLAIPERVDLIRRVGDNQEAMVRLNLRAIFNGTQPDFFLKPNDTINVGTSFIAAPLAVIRNGFRTSYGFGFLIDRNFDDQVFGARQNN